MSPCDQKYYAARARIERELASNAPDAGIAAIHRQLADRYEALARDREELPQEAAAA